MHAVDDVSFTLDREETLGLVGESGCGKSTTGPPRAALLDPTSGTIRFDGRAIESVARRASCASSAAACRSCSRTRTRR